MKNRSLKSESKQVKKRICVTPEQEKKIKKMISQGFFSEKIAQVLGLPIGVIKRYYTKKYFVIKNNNSDVCMDCGAKIQKGIFCVSCKRRISNIEDNDIFVHSNV